LKELFTRRKIRGESGFFSTVSEIGPALACFEVGGGVVKHDVDEWTTFM
jgi:hypothetical protein